MAPDASLSARTAVALGLAGLATAALGAHVVASPAQTRTYNVTTSDGSVRTVTVDVPAGTGVWEIRFPGIAPKDVVAIEETATPPGALPAATAKTPPATTTTTSTAPPAATTTPTTPARAGSGAGSGDGLTPIEEAERNARLAREAAQAARDRAERDARRVASGGAVDATAGAAAEPDSAPAASDPTLSVAAPSGLSVGVPSFFIDRFRIPPFLLPIYQAASARYGIPWQVLAAVNEIETDYGRNTNVSSAGALGWMQFMPATWRRWGLDANGDGQKDPYNAVDAIFAAARYLRAAGGESDLRRAIFAYNHADWYVDSVLMRARLIGGLPADLVDSLTGLTLGVFPVDGRARYSDDTARAARDKRVAKAHAASVGAGDLAASAPAVPGVNLFARPGAAVVATQDGTIDALGRTKRLGRFVRLRDDYGNTYTYGHLATLARRYPAAAPDRAAPKSRPVAGERRRLFAHPLRARAFASGGEEQIYGAADALGATVMHRMKRGARVAGGTTLGRVGPVTTHGRSFVRFELRPAGDDAPHVDPKPILDGWKLLQTTATARATGADPMFDRDVAGPAAGRALLMTKPELERRVLRDHRIDIYRCGRRDIRASRIDRRVLVLLLYLADSGLRPTVSSLECGHSVYTASRRISEHSTGSAVDIAKVNGIPILGHQGPGSIADLTIRRILRLPSSMQPHQIVSLMRYPDASNTLALADHDDHIHVGFRAAGGGLTPAMRATLAPGQWFKLVDRLGRLDNPTVRSAPSRAAITVKARRHRRGAPRDSL